MQDKGAVRTSETGVLGSGSDGTSATSNQCCESCEQGIPCFDPAALERARASGMSPAEGRPARIVVSGDQPIMRSALHLVIAARSGYEVPVETALCPKALGRLQDIGVDVLLLDFDLNDTSSDLPVRLQTLLSAVPNIPVLILTPDPEVEACQAAFRFGARGIVLKSKRIEDLFGAIDRIRRGDTWLEGPALQKLLGQSAAVKKTVLENDRIALLTRREHQIVEVVARGRTNRQVGEELFISDPTVRHHLCTIFDKLGVASRSELIVYAYRHGLADTPTRESEVPSAALRSSDRTRAAVTATV
jgi:DNA-binding NarL/FixJ family response regulator